MTLSVRPITCRAAIPFVESVHRRLPKVQGAMWAVAAVLNNSAVIGVAIVGHPARVWQDAHVLSVLRVAVIEGHPNACSMLYGACSRAAKAMGATSLVTYTHNDELGTSLKASGWIDAGLTSGGEHSRESRKRKPAVDPTPKRRWFAPWSEKAYGSDSSAGPLKS